MRLFVLFFLFLFFISSVAAENLSWFTNNDEAKQKWAAIPSYSRNATYGNIFGVHFFIYPSGEIGYYTGIESTISEDLFCS